MNLRKMIMNIELTLSNINEELRHTDDSSSLIRAVQLRCMLNELYRQYVTKLENIQFTTRDNSYEQLNKEGVDDIVNAIDSYDHLLRRGWYARSGWTGWRQLLRSGGRCE